MRKRDDGKTVIDIDCFCVDKGCQGNITIQPDRIDNTRVFMVEVTSSSGDEYAYMWISISQLQQLQEELSNLIKEFKE